MYDDRWRLVSRHDGTSYTEEIVHHHAGLDGFGGASDVDSVIMRRTFLSTGTPQTESKRWYVLQNWRQDPAVTISDAGVQRERAFFSPYGRVFGVPAGDVSFEGEFGSGDGTTISGWSTAYRAHADVNLDGTIDAADATGNTHATLGWDALSRDGSTIGYAGYVQDSYIPTLSHVRHRVYKSDLGRWIQRDPAGYVDGASLYEYARSSPVTFVDWSGLASRVGGGSGCGLGGVGVDSCGGGQPQGQWGKPRRGIPAHSDPQAEMECKKICSTGKVLGQVICVGGNLHICLCNEVILSRYPAIGPSYIRCVGIHEAENAKIRYCPDPPFQPDPLKPGHKDGWLRKTACNEADAYRKELECVENIRCETDQCLIEKCRLRVKLNCFSEAYDVACQKRVSFPGEPALADCEGKALNRCKR